MSERDEFSVFVFLPDGTYYPEERWIGAESAVKLVKRLSESVGARLGTISRIMITDGGDYCCFEWTHGQGVTFPKRQPTNQ